MAQSRAEPAQSLIGRRYFGLARPESGCDQAPTHRMSSFPPRKRPCRETATTTAAAITKPAALTSAIPHSSENPFTPTAVEDLPKGVLIPPADPSTRMNPSMSSISARTSHCINSPHEANGTPTSTAKSLSRQTTSAHATALPLSSTAIVCHPQFSYSRPVTWSLAAEPETRTHGPTEPIMTSVPDSAINHATTTTPIGFSRKAITYTDARKRRKVLTGQTR